MPEPMTLEEAVAWFSKTPSDRRADAENRGEDMGNQFPITHAAHLVLLAHARATLAQRREGVTFVCGGTPTLEGQRELDDFATYLRMKGRIEKQNQTQRREGVTEAMVNAALNSWFNVPDAPLPTDKFTALQRDDVHAMLTAALAASGEGAA